MAYVTGTATGVKDLFEKIRAQLKSNTELAAASPAQTWQELFYIEDNVEQVTTDMTLSAGVIETLFTNEINEVGFTNIILGTSSIVQKLRTAKAVTKLLLSKPNNTSTYMPNSIRLEYSDNGTTWTTVQTINTSTPVWTINETREYSGWAATGAHLYWRVVPVTVQNASNLHFGGLRLFNGTECVNSVCGETFLKGPGLAGTDEIFIAMKGMRKTSNNDYRLMLYGYTGFNATERTVSGNHPGKAVMAYPWTTVWDQAMTYWLTLSGRRIIASIKVSTVYEGFYMGFILPYATPTQYPYPLAIGGSMAGNGSASYTYQESRHSIFCMPGCSTNSNQPQHVRNDTSGLIVFHPTGVWQGMYNKSSYTTGTTNEYYTGSTNYVFPHTKFATESATSPSSGRTPFDENIGGGYCLFPHIIVAYADATPSTSDPLAGSNTVGGATLGELDGTKCISGAKNSTENTGTLDGKDYIVFQNTYRATVRDFWAMQKG